MIIVLGCLAVVLVVAGSYFFTSQNGAESAAVATSMPVESIFDPENAPVTAADKSMTAAGSVTRNQASARASNSADCADTSCSRPTAAVPNNSPVERVPALRPPVKTSGELCDSGPDFKFLRRRRLIAGFLAAGSAAEPATASCRSGHDNGSRSGSGACQAGG